MHHLQAALIKAEEEIAQLRDQVFQLQTQANELFESNFSQGMLHMISPYDAHGPGSFQRVEMSVTFVGTSPIRRDLHRRP